MEGHSQRGTHQLNLRKACWVAFGLFVLHSLMDVPGHRWGTAWVAIYVLGLGIEVRKRTPCWRPQMVWLRVLGGAAILLAGLRWQSASAQPWMPTRASVQRSVEVFNSSHDLREQALVATRVLGWVPLDWTWYFRRAQVALRLGDLKSADQDFRCARFLETVSVELPMVEARSWQGLNAAHRLGAWQEALYRAGSQRDNLYQELLQRPDLDDWTRARLHEIAGEAVTLQVMSVLNQPAKEFPSALRGLLQQNPSLRGVTPAVLESLFKRWTDIGDAELLLQLWPLQPTWEQPGWAIVAATQAKQGRWTEALATGFHYAPVPVLPVNPARAPLESLTHSFQVNPKDPVKGLELYFALREARQPEKARLILDLVSSMPNAPRYTHYLLAQSYREVGQDELAWAAFARYLASR
jgi:hypothetical protein